MHELLHLQTNNPTLPVHHLEEWPGQQDQTAESLPANTEMPITAVNQLSSQSLPQSCTEKLSAIQGREGHVKLHSSVPNVTLTDHQLTHLLKHTVTQLSLVDQACTAGVGIVQHKPAPPGHGPHQHTVHPLVGLVLAVLHNAHLHQQMLTIYDPHVVDMDPVISSFLLNQSVKLWMDLANTVNLF